jgi:hypothetical protein
MSAGWLAERIRRGGREKRAREHRHSKQKGDGLLCSRSRGELIKGRQGSRQQKAEKWLAAMTQALAAKKPCHSFQ